MALFKKKKKLSPQPLKKPRSNPLQTFPKYDVSSPEIPLYRESHQETSDQKYKPPGYEDFKMLPSLLRSETPKLELPKRKPEKPTLIRHEEEDFYTKLPELDIEEPEFRQVEHREIEPEPIHREPTHDDALFVKIEGYKKSLQNLRQVKDMLGEAEKIMSEIQNLKTEEEKELADWQKEITDIKEKLMEIDRNLFEYK